MAAGHSFTGTKPPRPIAPALDARRSDIRPALPDPRLPASAVLVGAPATNLPRRTGPGAMLLPYGARAHTRSFCREWCVVCCTHPSPQPLSQPALRGQDERPRRPPGALALARPLEASVHAAVLGVVDTHRAAGSERVAGSVAGRRSWGSGCPSAVSREIHARPPPCLGGLHSFRLFL